MKLKQRYTLFDIVDCFDVLGDKITPIFSQEFNVNKFFSKLARFATTIDLMYGYELPITFAEYEIKDGKNLILPFNPSLNRDDLEKQPWHNLGFVFDPYNKMLIKRLLHLNEYKPVSLFMGRTTSDVLLATPNSLAPDRKKYEKRCEAFLFKDFHPEEQAAELMHLDYWAHGCMVTALKAGQEEQLYKIAFGLSMLGAVPNENIAVLYYEGQIALAGVVAEDPNYQGSSIDRGPVISMSHVVAQRRTGLFSMFHSDLRRHFLFEIARKMHTDVYARYEDFYK